MSIERKLDQFYTNDDIAKKCYQILKQELIKNNIKPKKWLEPSAGEGAFYSLIEGNKLGIDIDPKIKGILKCDFLKYNLEDDEYITIGNPPFGKNSSLAIKFFNKCALHSKVIAFIVPKTFKKDSVKNKLNKKMHCIYEYVIPDNSFNFKKEIVNVPCVFQIWLKKDTEREIVKENITINDFEFCDRENANIAFQRVGIKAGTVKTKDMFNLIADQSHIFIKIKNNIAFKILNLIDWSEIKFNTAGNPSISKKELIKEYDKYKKNLICELNDSIIVEFENKKYFFINLKNIKIKLEFKNIFFNDNIFRLSIENNSIDLSKEEYIKIKNILIQEKN